MTMNKKPFDPCLWLPVILAIGVILKITLLIFGRVPFNADEAVVALMARHILQGESPVFFYGQAYMGSLNAFLTAGAFRLMGEQVLGVRLVQILLYLLIMLTTYYIGKKILGSPRAGLFAAALLAIPPVNMTLYTTASLGGYGEALLIGNLILLSAWLIKVFDEKVKTEKEYGARYWRVYLAMLAWSFLVGLGLWANAITMVYAVPSGFFVLRVIIRKAGWQHDAVKLIPVIVGFFLGSLPWWGFAFENGLSRLLGELIGQAVAVEGEPYWMRILTHLTGFFLFGLTALFGLRPPWEVNWLGLPLIPLVLAAWVGIIWYWLRRIKRNAGMGLLNGIAIVFFGAFVFTSFGIDSSGRYFLPLGVILSLIAGKVIDEWIYHKPALGYVMPLLLVFQLWGNIQCALRFPPGFTTQFYAPARVEMSALPEVIDFLRKTGEVRGYSNYWVAYPLAFLSQEEIIFSPRLPYHPDLRYTSRDDRYPDYTRQVESSKRIAFITTLNPLLDQQLRAGLRALGIKWQEIKIGDFRIYHDLSTTVRIEQLADFIYR
jgi:4-amino-4-deoxy-L-arabinose transferase-like glycosyltransferase